MIQLVKRMTESPAQCLACGGNPMDVSGRAQKAVDLGVDVNWGDNAYLCWECVNLIADMIGRPDEGTVEKAQERIKFLDTRNKKMAAEMAEQEKLLKRIKDGRDALREVKADAN